MRKKLSIVGSIGAAIILILVSLTTVVGVKVNESLIKKLDSPLFGLRTQKAIKKDKTEEDITADYVGKGKNKLIVPIFKSYYNKLMSDKWVEFLTSNKSPTENEETYFKITCGFVCFWVGAVILMFFILIISIASPLFCLSIWDEKYCSETNQLLPLHQKMQNNPLFEKLIINHPELFQEIVELNC